MSTLVGIVVLLGVIVFIYIIISRSIRYGDYKNQNKNIKEYFKREKKILKNHNNVITNWRIAFTKRLRKNKDI